MAKGPSITSRHAVQRLSGTPGLSPSWEIPAAHRELIRRLVHIFSGYALLDPRADCGFEKLLNVVPDYEHHAVKTCLHRVVNRVIYQQLSARTELLKLLYPCAEACSHACRKDYQSHLCHNAPIN